MRQQTLPHISTIFAIGAVVALLVDHPRPAHAQRGTSGRGANFARGMMGRGGGGGGGGRGAASAGRGGARGGGAMGGPAMRGGGGGPSVQRGGGNRGGGRSGSYSGRGNPGRGYPGRGYPGRGRGRGSSFGIGVYGPSIGLYYGPGYGRYGYGYGNYYGFGRDYYGYGVPYYGRYPGYTRYGYSRAVVPNYGYRSVNPVYGYVQPQQGTSVQSGQVYSAPPAGQVVQNRVVFDGSNVTSSIPAAANAAPYQAQAEQAFRNNKIEDAIRLSHHAVVEDGQNGKLHLFAAQALFAGGRYAEAVDALRVATSLLPRDEWGHVIENYKQFYRGSNYVSQMNRLVEFIGNNPDAAYAKTLRGFQYKYLGYDEAAQSQLTKAQQANPQDDLAAKLLGSSDAEANDGDAADQATADQATGDAASDESDAAVAVETLPGPPEPQEPAEITDATQVEEADDAPADATDASVNDDEANSQEISIAPPSQNPPPIPKPE